MNSRKEKRYPYGRVADLRKFREQDLEAGVGSQNVKFDGDLWWVNQINNQEKKVHLTLMENKS